MTTCPNCNAEAFAALKHHVQKTATATGGVAGAIRGVSSALAESALADATVVNGRRLHLIANAIIGGLRGGATGCAAGSLIGETIKQSVTAVYLCKECGHSFD
ncbi:hypothetical protein [Rhodanobacter sp. K2T2]|uniref:hypothetical protein n=1 Tax=Rhodanobacter sp. K2T2 TaxID=2723085 RepID=UPI0015C93A83|nr:hypothetical protein [Rhodanobacter sp. K2T2]NYE30044.1 DNA-directed RNA polymerase subunit RPC12/RpoP [Rhodanobacter sp. K2T2]